MQVTPTKFPHIYQIGQDIATKALVPGKVYGERWYKDYRIWDPWRSKIAAAIKNGLSCFPIKKSSIILYLGAGSGTTVSHLSDIVTEGAIFALEFAPIPMKSLLFLAKKRKNIIPLFYDAREPDQYSDIPKVDILYQDIAQQDQISIFQKNLRFLKPNGHAFLIIKARSIDVTKSPDTIYAQVSSLLSPHLLETINLDPYQKDHAMFVFSKSTLGIKSKKSEAK
jgi:fibrillarin-like pre-rRNA processing protein